MLATHVRVDGTRRFYATNRRNEPSQDAAIGLQEGVMDMVVPDSSHAKLFTMQEARQKLPARKENTRGTRRSSSLRSTLSTQVKRLPMEAADGEWLYARASLT